MEKCFRTTFQKYIESELPPFALIMVLRRAFSETQERRRTSSFNLVQADWKAAFCESILGWEQVKTSIC